MENVIDASDNNFEKEVIEKSKNVPVMVDFWSETCPPCRMLGPTLEKLAKDYGGKFILAKVDLQKNRQKVQEYEISSIPNIKMFKDGKIVDEFIGAVSEEEAKEFLDKNI